MASCRSSPGPVFTGVLVREPAGHIVYSAFSDSAAEALRLLDRLKAVAAPVVAVVQGTHPELCSMKRALDARLPRDPSL